MGCGTSSPKVANSPRRGGVSKIPFDFNDEEEDIYAPVQLEPSELVKLDAQAILQGVKGIKLPKSIYPVVNFTSNGYPICVASLLLDDHQASTIDLPILSIGRLPYTKNPSENDETDAFIPKSGRIALFGSIDFLANTFFECPESAAFLENLISWGSGYKSISTKLLFVGFPSSITTHATKYLSAYGSIVENSQELKAPLNYDIILLSGIAYDSSMESLLTSFLNDGKSVFIFGGAPANCQVQHYLLNKFLNQVGLSISSNSMDSSDNESLYLTFPSLESYTFESICNKYTQLLDEDFICEEVNDFLEKQKAENAEDNEEENNAHMAKMEEFDDIICILRYYVQGLPFYSEEAFKIATATWNLVEKIKYIDKNGFFLPTPIHSEFAILLTEVIPKIPPQKIKNLHGSFPDNLYGVTTNNHQSSANTEENSRINSARNLQTTTNNKDSDNNTCSNINDGNKNDKNSSNSSVKSSTNNNSKESSNNTDKNGENNIIDDDNNNNDGFVITDTESFTDTTGSEKAIGEAAYVLGTDGKKLPIDLSDHSMVVYVLPNIWNFTGLFLPAGTIGRIISDSPLLIQVGAHSSPLLFRPCSLNRWPSVTHRVFIEPDVEIEIASPFGGIIYLITDIPKTVQIQFKRFGFYPCYFYEDVNGKQKWNETKISNAPWGEIILKNGTFVLPAIRLKEIDDLTFFCQKITKLVSCILSIVGAKQAPYHHIVFDCELPTDDSLPYFNDILVLDLKTINDIIYLKKPSFNLFVFLLYICYGSIVDAFFDHESEMTLSRVAAAYAIDREYPDNKLVQTFSGGNLQLYESLWQFLKSYGSKGIAVSMEKLMNNQDICTTAEATKFFVTNLSSQIHKPLPNLLEKFNHAGKVEDSYSDRLLVFKMSEKDIQCE